MSMFEFVTVMVSMILALCLGHLLRSGSILARTNREVRYYLPFMLWSVVMFLSVVNHWWSLWDLRDVNWHYGSFLYVLLAPILITFGTGLLSPVQPASGPIDLEAQYSRIRRPMSAALVSYVTVMWFDGPLLAGQAVFGIVGLLHIPILVADLTPGFTANRKANILAASTVIAILLAIMVVRYSAT